MCGAEPAHGTAPGAREAIEFRGSAAPIHPCRTARGMPGECVLSPRDGAQDRMNGARWSSSGPLPLSTVRSPAAYSLVVPVITIVINNRTTRANESSVMATSTQRRRRPKGT